MQRKVFSSWFICFLIIGITGCASNSLSKSPLARVGTIPGYEESQSPVDVSIISESYKESALAVSVLISPNVALEPKQLKLILTGLQDGEILNTASLIPAQRMKAGKGYEFPLELSGEGLTDYRIDVEWGGQILAKPIPQLTIDKVSTIRTDCKDALCWVEFKVLATIANNGVAGEASAMLSNLVLATSFKVKGRAQPIDTAQEDEISVNDMQLMPGDVRQIEIALEQEVARQIVNNIEPEVRIASFN